jgi:hypothetical protein
MNEPAIAASSSSNLDHFNSTSSGGIVVEGDGGGDNLLATSSSIAPVPSNNSDSKDDLALLDGGDLDGDAGSSPQHHMGDIDDVNDTSLKDIDDTIDFGGHQAGDGKRKRKRIKNLK